MCPSLDALPDIIGLTLRHMFFLYSIDGILHRLCSFQDIVHVSFLVRRR